MPVASRCYTRTLRVNRLLSLLPPDPFPPPFLYLSLPIPSNDAPDTSQSDMRTPLSCRQPLMPPDPFFSAHIQSLSKRMCLSRFGCLFLLSPSLSERTYRWQPAHIFSLPLSMGTDKSLLAHLSLSGTQSTSRRTYLLHASPRQSSSSSVGRKSLILVCICSCFGESLRHTLVIFVHNCLEGRPCSTACRSNFISKGGYDSVTKQER